MHTKEDYQRLLLKLLEPLKGRYSENGAKVYLKGAGASYPEEIIEMEAFARPLWGLVPFWAGGGRDEFWEKQYQKGLLAGTDPKNKEYWGECGDCDQRFVEMAPIACGLLMAPHILWEPFNQRQKEHIASWLYQINHHELPKCNWYYFRILVNLALKNRKCPYSEELLKSDLEYMEQCYLGDGWYVDGVSRQKDYYSAFAMEFYSQIFAVFAETEENRGQCIRLKDRARKFQREFVYWFDKTGAALPYGRSLTYRFAQAASWSAALFSDAAELEFGEIKGIINRNIRYWIKKDIFQGDEILSVGYGYANLSMAEKYNAPGSPYWCLKVFLILALEDEHPYWKAEEKELPPLDFIHPMVYADMLVQHWGKEACGYVPAVYNQNVLGHFVEKYGKFVYSTRFGFSIAHSSENISEAAPDSMLALVPEGEQRVYVRTRSLDYKIYEDRIYSKWSPIKGVVIETTILPAPFGHIREHVIESRDFYKAYECGFAIAKSEPGFEVSAEGGDVQVKNICQFCRVKSFIQAEDDRQIGVPYIIAADPNTNVLYKNTVIPAMMFDIKPGITVIKTQVETR